MLRHCPTEFAVSMFCHFAVLIKGSQVDPKGSQTHLHQVDPCASQLAGSILPQAPVKAAQQLLCLHQGDPAKALMGDSAQALSCIREWQAAP